MRRLSLAAAVALFSLLGSCTQQSAEEPLAPASVIVPDKPEKPDLSYEAMLAYVPAEERGEVTALVDGLIDAALGAARDADARTRVLLMTWYVHSHFESADVSPYSIAGMLREQKAQCGGSSITLQLMARRLGYRTRTAGFFGIPNQGGHTTAEVEWDGRWHYVDPTYGAFLTSDGTLDGEIVSFDTMQAHRYEIWRNTFYAKSLGRLGKGHPARDTDDLATLYSLEDSVLAWSGDYRLFLENYKGATVYAADEGKFLDATFEVDFGYANPVTIGTDDGASSDIVLHMQTYPNYDATGLQFLGDLSGTYGKLVGMHSYSILGVQPNEVLIYRGKVLEGSVSDIQVTARKAEILQRTDSGRTFELELRALRADAELHLEAATGKVLIFDSHRFERRN